MNNQDVTPTLQELMAQMAPLQAELTDLKTRANALTPPVQPLMTEITTTRRKILRRLAVAGVISTRPGMSLGASNPADGGTNLEPQLALAGRIPVKVTAEGGPIRPGDLLIASSTPGHAQRAGLEPQTGSVLGKALGHLANGSGTVEMLVMLR